MRLLLSTLQNMPCRKLAQQLLSLALGGGASWWALQAPYCSAKADSISTQNTPASKPPSSRTPEQPGSGGAASLPDLLAKLLGENQFANVGQYMGVPDASIDPSIPYGCDVQFWAVLHSPAQPTADDLRRALCVQGGLTLMLVGAAAAGARVMLGSAVR